MNRSNPNYQTFFNVLSTVVFTGINSFTMSLYSRMLGTSQYGVYSVFSSWVSILIPIIGLETASCVSVAKYDFKEDYVDFNKYNIILCLLLSMLSILLSFLFKNAIANVLGFPIVIIFSMLFTVLTTNIITYYQNILIYDKKADVNFYLSLLLAVFTTALSFIFIKNNVFKELYMGRVYGTLIPYAIVSIVLFLKIIIPSKGKFNKNYWSYSLNYGIPIVFHLLSQELMSQSNKLLLNYLGYSSDIVGLFSFFHTFATVISIVINSLNSSWVPFCFDLLNQKDEHELKKKTKNYVELTTVLVIGFMLLSREVSLLFAGEEYAEGVYIIPIFVLSFYFMFLYQFPVNFEFFSKKTKMISIGTVCSGLVNIVSNVILIPRYGMIGSACSTLLSYISLFLVHYYIANHLNGLEYKLKMSFFIVPLLLVIVSSIMFYIFPSQWYIRWTVGAFLGIYELIAIIKRKSIF